MANPEHISIAREGVDALEAWYAENPGVLLELSHSDPAEVDFLTDRRLPRI
jgi:hypothetical protein